MFHVKCLILKHSIVDALSTLAIALTEVSRLDHEALHYTMKRCSLSRKLIYSCFMNNEEVIENF